MSSKPTATNAILGIGGMHDGGKQETYRIDKGVAFLARAVARRFDAGPLFPRPLHFESR